MTVVAIHQPQYLPWIPYCDKADRCDVFVYLDNVQFQKNGVQNRNQIKTAQGQMWLTVPVEVTLGEIIQQVRISGNRWKNKHIRAIQQNYSHAAYFEAFEQGLRPILEREWTYLADLNIALTEWMFKQLGITCTRLRASDLRTHGVSDDLVISICQAVGASVYLSGQGAKHYQDAMKFAERGINLTYQMYQNQPYVQCHPALGFVPDLSALDLILNTGPQAKDIMRKGRPQVG